MMTKNKKQYAALLKLQEGKIINPPKIDIKGLATKKTNNNRTVGKEFNDAIKKHILEPDEVQVNEILNLTAKIKRDIEVSLLNGETTYVKPDKVNSISSYAMPNRIQSVNGSVLWNRLYPEDIIHIPDKVNKINLSIDKYRSEYEEGTPDIDIIYDILMNDEENELSEEEVDRIIEIINMTIFENSEIAKYGLYILCFPKTVTKIPKWIIPFIDISLMQQDILAMGKAVMESLYLTILDYQVGSSKGQVTSNIITF